VVRNRIFDDLEQFFLRIGGTNGESVQQLNHQTGEPFEGTRNADGWVNFDEDAFRSVDVDLELASLIDRRVEKSEEALLRGGRPKRLAILKPDLSMEPG
jgi:hypothetical protein